MLASISSLSSLFAWLARLVRGGRGNTWARGAAGPPAVLLVVRHAHAEPARDGSDRERPLSERGRRDAARLGRLLAQMHAEPDAIITSPALRARDTARAIAESSGSSAALAEEDRLYTAGADVLSELVERLASAPRTVVAVGHDPAFSQWLRRSTGHREPLPKGGVAVVEVVGAGGVRAAELRLRELWRPRPARAATEPLRESGESATVEESASVAHFARRVIAVSLDRVLDRMERAGAESELPPENVRRLRVACKRAEVAIQVYRRIVDRRAARRVRSALERIRKAARGVRELDVALAAARELAGDASGDSTPVLVDLQARRLAAASRLRGAVAEEVGARGFAKRAAGLLDGIASEGKRQRRGGRAYHGWAQRALADAAERFFASDAGLGASVDERHELRLAVKRLRYSMDALAFDPGGGLAPEGYALVVELQDLLGRASDRSTAATVLAEVARSDPDSDLARRATELRQVELEGLARACLEIRAWWTDAARSRLRHGLMAPPRA